MLLRAFYYSFLKLVRIKEALFWNLCFPIALGTLYFVAFSGLNSDEQFGAIDVAVVLEETTDTSAFQTTVEALSEEGDDQLLSAIFTTEEEALELLEKKEVAGILYEGPQITLTVSAEMTDSKLDQSILNCFVEQYNLNINAINSTMETHPENIAAVLDLTNVELNYHKETSLIDGSLDSSLGYFFNLIAMSCLYSYMGGISVVVNSQANLSTLGMRKCVSPVNHFVSLLGELLGAIVYHYLCNVISLVYLIVGLKIDFGNELGLIFLSTLIACITGVSFGFFVGSIGRMSEGMKAGIMMALTMICCFLSGLMINGIRLIVEQVVPWFNKINPAALISDSFYSLSVCQSHDRLFANLLILLTISICFYLGGFLMIRRKKYAAL